MVAGAATTGAATGRSAAGAPDTKGSKANGTTAAARRRECRTGFEPLVVGLPEKAILQPPRPSWFKLIQPRTDQVRFASYDRGRRSGNASALFLGCAGGCMMTILRIAAFSPPDLSDSAAVSSVALIHERGLHGYQQPQQFRLAADAGLVEDAGDMGAGGRGRNAENIRSHRHAAGFDHGLQHTGFLCGQSKPHGEGREHRRVLWI